MRYVTAEATVDAPLGEVEGRAVRHLVRSGLKWYRLRVGGSSYGSQFLGNTRPTR